MFVSSHDQAADKVFCVVQLCNSNWPVSNKCIDNFLCWIIWQWCM